MTIDERTDPEPGLMVSKPMLIPEADAIICPQCHSQISMTVAAVLRARRQGVAVSCPQCGGAWLYTLHPLPEFGPLTTPKRRRGPPRKHFDDDELPPSETDADEESDEL